MAKIDKIDRLIRDYVNGFIDKRIEAIENRYRYKSKIDNLGIRTAYSGVSEQERAILLKEQIENDPEIINLKYQKNQIEAWYHSFPDAKMICELRWKKNMQQWEIEQEMRMSRSTVYNRYVELKAEIIRWSGLEL